MVTLYGHCLAQARADPQDKNSLSGKMANMDVPRWPRCDADISGVL